MFFVIQNMGIYLYTYAQNEQNHYKLIFLIKLDYIHKTIHTSVCVHICTLSILLG